VNPSSAYRHHINKRSLKIYRFVDESARVYSVEYFHHLRVEIKKLNAALRLVKYCSPEFSRKRVFKPYKLLGKAAGEVREIQLEESVIRKVPQGHFTKQYLTGLKDQRLHKKKHFLEVKNQVSKSLKKRVQKILPYADEIEQVKMTEYFDLLKGRCISKMNGKKLATANIHDLRTLLKEFVYNTEVHRDDIKSAFKKTILLQDLVGKWHDYHVIIGHLYNYRRKISQPAAYIKQLNLVRSGISAKASQLINRINKMKAEVESELR
jgi:CHAD domain-containing protein